MIYEGSRYSEAVILRVADASGEVRPAVYPAIRRGMLAYSTYVLATDERYDLIAQRLFGDPQLWWTIADLNPEYLYPDQLPAGTVIRVPVS